MLFNIVGRVGLRKQDLHPLYFSSYIPFQVKDLLTPQVVCLNLLLQNKSSISYKPGWKGYSLQYGRGGSYLGAGIDTCLWFFVQVCRKDLVWWQKQSWGPTISKEYGEVNSAVNLIVGWTKLISFRNNCSSSTEPLQTKKYHPGNVCIVLQERFV